MFSFDLTPEQGEKYRVTATSRDVLTWEKAVKGRSFGELANAPSMDGMYGLAYAASRRQGRFAGTLAEFEASVDLEMVTDDEDSDEAEPDPTRAGAGPARSSRSPSPPASRRASGSRKTNGQ